VAHAAAADEAWRGDHAVYLDRLKRLHLERLGRKPEIPKPPEPAQGEATVEPTEHAIGVQEPLLRTTNVVEDAELAALDQARAEAVRGG
jgi:hypothetical protein